MTTSCAVADCDRKLVARGWCLMHWKRWRAHGSTQKWVRPTIAARFWARVDTSAGIWSCWPWTRARSPGGYGKVWDGGEKRANRVAWELTNGPIPAGFMACHTCDNPPCCNPAHLFLGTAADNAADRDAKGRNGSIGRRRVGTRPCTDGCVATHKAHCPAGHPFNEANAYVGPDRRHRCRACHREYVSRYRARRNAA